MRHRKTDPDQRLSAEALKAKVNRLLQEMGEISSSDEESALVARWPEPLLHIPSAEREKRVRHGSDTMIFDDPTAPGQRRAFMRAVLRVPLESPTAQVYGVFVEVDQPAYTVLKGAFQRKEAVTVQARLATKLPLLEDAYESEVVVFEDGGDRRARIIDAHHEALKLGPRVGPGR
ncbi:MAG: DUF2199 domain-containing protein [Myxococcota bacterium]